MNAYFCQYSNVYLVFETVFISMIAYLCVQKISMYEKCSIFFKIWVSLQPHNIYILFKICFLLFFKTSLFHNHLRKYRRCYFLRTGYRNLLKDVKIPNKVLHPFLNEHFSKICALYDKPQLIYRNDDIH